LKETNVKKKKKLYEGKAKIVYETENEELYIQEFKDDATAFNGKKKGKIKDKGKYNNLISGQLFDFLESYHVPTHYVGPHGESAMVIKSLDMLPIEVVMRNIATGSLVKRTGIKDGTKLDSPLLEFYLKDDEKGDPMIDEKEILSSEYATEEELDQIKKLAQKINAVLRDFFKRRQMILVDFKLEFGRGKSGKLRLGDEISPDTCRFWDIESGKKMDKDRFRQDLGAVEEAYEEVFNRVFR